MEVGLPASRLTRRDAPRPETGIVHFGLGAFFRAFGCVYIADAMAASGGDWGITGVSLRSAGTRDALRNQGWAYTAVSLGPDGATPRVIEVLDDVLVAPENPFAVLDVMAKPPVKIVTLTVTEKGYCHHPATGALNVDHPDILHDLASPTPKSAIGYVVRGLQMRHAAGGDPFTVLTCDNLPNNGKLVRGLVLELAALIDPILAEWITTHGKFPGTMVDRITPATMPADIAQVEQMTGQLDAAPVMHEPFAQWVIEDDFVGGNRPDFAAVGVDMVRDVAPFEDMKLRMLNGTHSALAYAGYLAGHKTISDTVADPVFAAFARGLWDEIMPTVQAPDGVDLPAYADGLFDRYANPNIRHRTWQIAMDGSQKLPQRIFGTVQDSATSTPLLSLAIACWMRYVGGKDETGELIDVQDPLAQQFQILYSAAKTPEQAVAALLGLREIFSNEMAVLLFEPVTLAAHQIWTHGTRGAIARGVGSG